ncbi:UNVERIFIED_CONTAM: hypothetical protein PYX00_000452 [Menopon gallinae]|uniref:Uncharacterized protein n=1 Tax=Menopon gallinae TaxID=328185 RepID=A0AAW2IAF1_9NEOP
MASAAAKLAFQAQTANDFVWPYPKPLREITEEPPLETKEKNYYLPRIPPQDCGCYAHGCEVSKYRELAEKKAVLTKHIELLDQQMTAITNDMLDSPCGVSDETMKTIYQTDFEKRGWPFTSYRKLMAETDCELCPPPVYRQVLGLKNGYRDFNSFRLVPHPLPGIDPAKPITFSKTPDNMRYYWTNWPGRTEYQDTYSRQGFAAFKAAQNYREPLPTTRRRLE